MAEIVVFENGKYALRKGFFFHRYLDLEWKIDNIWWSRKSRFFPDCLADSEYELVDALYERRISKLLNKDKGTPV